MTVQRSGTEAFTFTDRITGRKILQLTNSSLRSVHGYYDLPPWSPITGDIAFTSLAPRAAEGDVYRMKRDGSDITYVAHSNAVSANDGAMAQWSYDGRRIYYRDCVDDQSVVAWADAATGKLGHFAGDLRMMSPVANENVHFTHAAGAIPDEMVPLSQDKLAVFVQNLDTGVARQIVTVAQCLEINPRRDEARHWHLYIKHTKWSLDGKRIMFVFTNEISYAPKYGELPHVKDIYVINADGTGLRRVGEFGNHLLWHPNGTEILTNSPYPGRPNNSLVLLNADTGERRLATAKIAGLGHPSFSPDGKWIAVDHALAGEGSGSINLVDVRRDEVIHAAQLRVMDHSHVGTHLHPVWSQDSRQVLYASDASGAAQLCVIDV